MSLLVLMWTVFLAHLLLDAECATDHGWTLPKDDRHIDFSNISKTLRNLFADDIDHSCGMPARAVIFTYSNQYHMQLLQLQHQSTQVEGGSDKRCLADRFVTICLDRQCHSTCESLGLHHCTLVSTSVFKYPPSRFREGAFFYLSFLKYLIIQEAFKEATELFFVDADVLLYCNPWQHIALFNDTQLDFVYSPEFVNRRSFINGGQYFLRRSTRVQAWLQLMIKARDLICNPRNSRMSPAEAPPRRPSASQPRFPSKSKSKSNPPPLLLDQDYARIYAQRVGLSVAPAPVRQLGSHNHHHRHHGASNRDALTAFPATACTNHVCGVTGDEKLDTMRQYLKLREARETERSLSDAASR